MLFWCLNAQDQALALILGRLPIFQRDLLKAMSMPTLEDLLSTRPFYSNGGMPVLFAARFDEQMYLLSRVQVEVWYCVHGQETHNVDQTRTALESWCTEASKESYTLSERRSRSNDFDRSLRQLLSRKSHFSMTMVKDLLIFA